MDLRQSVLIDQEVRSEGGRVLPQPTRRAAAAAALIASLRSTPRLLG